MKFELGEIIGTMEGNNFRRLDKLSERFNIIDKLSFHLATVGTSHAFFKFLSECANWKGNIYSNKDIVVIDYDRSLKQYTCGWSYDGHYHGVFTIQAD